MIIPVPKMPVQQQQQQPQPTPMKKAAAPKKIARPISPPPRAPYSRSNVYQKAHVPVPLKAQALETIAERSSVASRSTVSGSRGVTSGSRGIASGSRGIASGIASTQSASAANKSGSHNNKTGSTAYSNNYSQSNNQYELASHLSPLEEEGEEYENDVFTEPDAELAAPLAIVRKRKSAYSTQASTLVTEKMVSESGITSSRFLH